MKPTMLHNARLLPLTAAAGLALLLAAAGCTGRSPTASEPTIRTPAATTPAPGPPTPAPTSTDPPVRTPTPVPPTTPSGPDRCDTADLSAHLTMLDSSAGSRYAAVVLKNRSTSTCRVYGYGGVQLLDAAHRPLPTHQIRDRTSPPHRVLLRPGASANSRLHLHPFGSGSESQTEPCQPTASYLLVTPPDETQPITLKWPSGPVCSQGTFGQTAYTAGTTPID